MSFTKDQLKEYICIFFKNNNVNKSNCNLLVEHLLEQTNLKLGVLFDFSDRDLFLDWLSKNEPNNEKLINWIKQKKFEFKRDFRALSSKELSEGFIREFKDRVDWEIISKYQKLSESFIREFKDRVDWIYVFLYQKLSESFIREFRGILFPRYKQKSDNIHSFTKVQLIEYIYDLFKSNNVNKTNCDLLVESLLEQTNLKLDEFVFSDRDLFLEWLSKNESDNKKLINWVKTKKFELKKDFRALSKKELSERFIREFKDRVDWWRISKYQKLSESFIREFVDRVDWYYVSKYQKLSESFIREFEDRVNWDSRSLVKVISQYQKLSERFIREFKDRVDWDMVSKYQDISDQFANEFRDRINWELYMEARNKRVKQVLEDFVK